jgi:hypothetical protein
MISDQVFDSVSEKAALSFEWIELDAIVAQVGVLQAQRSAAKMHGNVERLNALTEELDAALTERERLVSRIGNGIGA